jgi:hypothetical protein
MIFISILSSSFFFIISSVLISCCAQSLFASVVYFPSCAYISIHSSSLTPPLFLSRFETLRRKIFFPYCCCVYCFMVILSILLSVFFLFFFYIIFFLLTLLMLMYGYIRCFAFAFVSIFSHLSKIKSSLLSNTEEAKKNAGPRRKRFD